MAQALRLKGVGVDKIKNLYYIEFTTLNKGVTDEELREAN
jgi:hypothetical protein